MWEGTDTCMYTCVLVPHVQKRVSDLFKLEITGFCHLPDMGAGNETLVPCKSIK